MNDYAKQMQEAAATFGEQLKAAMPKVTFNKNGYEIRAQVLEMAQGQVWQDFHARLGAFEASVAKDGKEVVAAPVSKNTHLFRSSVTLTGVNLYLRLK